MSISKVASWVCFVEIWDLIWIEDGALGSSLVDEIVIRSNLFGSNLCRPVWIGSPL